MLKNWIEGFSSHRSTKHKEIPKNFSLVDFSTKTIDDVVHLKVKEEVEKAHDGSFVIYNLSQVIHQYKKWYEYFPNVKVYYAMKANDDPEVLSLMATLGSSFDCASQSEISRVMALGVPTSKIIFANPIKSISMLRYAKERGVSLMTADSAGELRKIAKHYPEAKIVIRILTPSVKSGLDLGRKFGIPSESFAELVGLAKELHLNVVGVSFHVGSPSNDPRGHALGVAHAYQALEVIADAGYKPHYIDIGGGFPGVPPYMKGQTSFEEIAKFTKEALDKYFPQNTFRGRPIEVIAEPGQYMCFSAVTLVCTVIGKKNGNETKILGSLEESSCFFENGLESDMDGEGSVGVSSGPPSPIHSMISPQTMFRGVFQGSQEGSEWSDVDSERASTDAESGLSLNNSLRIDNSSYPSLNGYTFFTGRPTENGGKNSDSKRFVYYISDGKYGAFTFLAYIEEPFTLQVVRKIEENEPRYLSCMYGPTCDSLDKVLDGYYLPELYEGDWVYFQGMGAYTTVMGCEFNGFPKPHPYYVLDSQHEEFLRHFK